MFPSNNHCSPQTREWRSKQSSCVYCCCLIKTLRVFTGSLSKCPDISRMKLLTSVEINHLMVSSLYLSIAVTLIWGIDFSQWWLHESIMRNRIIRWILPLEARQLDVPVRVVPWLFKRAPTVYCLPTLGRHWFQFDSVYLFIRIRVSESSTESSAGMTSSIPSIEFHLLRLIVKIH